MTPPAMLALVAFLCASSLMLLVALLVGGRNRRMEGRLQHLVGQGPAPNQAKQLGQISRSVLPKLSKPLEPTSEDGRTRLRSRLVHAGYYGPHAMMIFLGVKMILMAVPVVAGFALAASGMVPSAWALLYGLSGSLVGMIGPGLWLDSRKRRRQVLLRRGLPDALDMIVICLKGGLSLQGAFQRVSTEIGMAHPLLSSELIINHREIQLGSTIGDAMKHFAERSDLEEIHSLAAVIIQSEKLGASLVTAMRVHAETMRLRRLQRAEELAHKAGTKMVFPTILCIFPAILLVVLGPAAYQVSDLFKSMK